MKGPLDITRMVFLVPQPCFDPIVKLAILVPQNENVFIKENYL